MAVAQQMSEAAYLEFVQSGVEGPWELHDGVLVEKPRMSREHGSIVSRLARQLLAQLDEAEYEVRINEGRVRGSEDSVSTPE